MPTIKFPLPDQIIDKLNPILQKLIIELGVKEVDFSEDYTEFVYLGKTIRIKITIQ